MKTKIFHSTNEGLYLSCGGGILIDGLHLGREYGFSDTPEEFRAMLADGGTLPLSALIFTHKHKDHFDRQAAGTLMAERPEIILYVAGEDILHRGCATPQNTKSGGAAVQGLTGGAITSFEVGDALITAFTTVHDGDRFEKEYHESFIIKAENGETFFIAGDAKFSPEDMPRIKDRAGDAPITAAFINSFQAQNAGAHELLRLLAPERIFLYHLPLPKDDRYNSQSIAKSSIKKFPEDLPKPELLRQMAWVG